MCFLERPLLLVCGLIGGVATFLRIFFLASGFRVKNSCCMTLHLPLLCLLRLLSLISLLIRVSLFSLLRLIYPFHTL